jgi:hypothetical protein
MQLYRCSQVDGNLPQMFRSPPVPAIDRGPTCGHGNQLKRTRSYLMAMQQQVDNDQIIVEQEGGECSLRFQDLSGATIRVPLEYCVSRSGFLRKHLPQLGKLHLPAGYMSAWLQCTEAADRCKDIALDLSTIIPEGEFAKHLRVCT